MHVFYDSFIWFFDFYAVYRLQCQRISTNQVKKEIFTIHNIVQYFIDTAL